jgi:hypothetical protein
MPEFERPRAQPESRTVQLAAEEIPLEQKVVEPPPPAVQTEAPLSLRDADAEQLQRTTGQSEHPKVRTFRSRLRDLGQHILGHLFCILRLFFLVFSHVIAIALIVGMIEGVSRLCGSDTPHPVTLLEWIKLTWMFDLMDFCIVSMFMYSGVREFKIALDGCSE